MYDNSVIPKSLDALIISLCADFGRRKRIIERKNAPYNVIMECRFLNYKILDAAIGAAGPKDAALFIKEIGEGTGYAQSALINLSEVTYKERKRAVKRSIAKRLSLI